MDTNIISEEYNIIFKVVLIGDSAVGKTNILSRYIKDDFSIETKNTVGVEFGSKIIKYKENTIKFKYGIQQVKNVIDQLQMHIIKELKQLWWFMIYLKDLHLIILTNG